MTITEIKKVLDESSCCYEIIEQDKPILSVLDAERFYPVEKSAPTFVLQWSSVKFSDKIFESILPWLRSPLM